MPPPTPEPRFEVPPEYAEVYERAYRRAYEEGQGRLGSDEAADPVRRVRGRRGRRLSRSSRRATGVPRPAEWAPPWPGDHLGGDPDGASPDPEEAEPVPEEPQPTGHRARRRTRRSSVGAALGAVALALVLLTGAFALGRLSVGRVDVPGVPAAAPPAGQGSVSVVPLLPARAAETGLAGLQAALEPPGPYRGPVARLGGARAQATCAAPAARDARGRRVSYAPRNVLDGVAATAWLCRGSAVGQRLTITLPVTADVVRVGVVPGYAKTDRYPRNNRVTTVAWVFDDGTRVVQPLGDSRTDRSLRTLRIEPVRTRTVVLEILTLTRGANNNTAISAIRLDTYTSGGGG